MMYKTVMSENLPRQAIVHYVGPYIYKVSFLCPPVNALKKCIRLTYLDYILHLAWSFPF